ncbi:hypothetical protein ONS95_012339 [Cadophora gregata]|uniref:uncharacterized protein n=1 Tax=Cadophora gregata TaxID=51156 RepID=UPI0026DB7AC5|nr:uncharacterized protein ONS95_012339 [Cadophora gregata]KAK0118029.1 hypothetical protein ONS95_012339 [Cadophora gregata]
METSPDRKIQTSPDLSISTSQKASEMSDPITPDASKTVSSDRNTTRELACSESKLASTSEEGSVVLKLATETNPDQTASTEKQPTTPKSTAQISPSIRSRNVADKPTTGLEQTAAVEVMVNFNSSPETFENGNIKVTTDNTNNLKVVNPDPAINIKQGEAPPTIQSKPSLPFNDNKENVKPVPVGAKSVETTITAEINTSPKTNATMSDNHDSGQMKRIRELQAKCRDRGIATYGSPTQLVHRLLASDHREREFEQEHERQMRELRKQKGEDQSHTSPQNSSRASSPGISSHASNGQSQVAPARSQAPTSQRQDNFFGTKIRSPTMPNATAPFAKSLASQSIQAQQVVDPSKVNTVKTVGNFASHDVRSQTNAIPAKVVAANTLRPSAPQAIRVHQAGQSVNANTAQNARRFASQDIRLYRNVQPANSQGVKTIPQETGLIQAVKNIDAKFATTSQADDRANFLHKKTFEIKNECLRRGLSAYGSRKDLVSRLMYHHLAKLKAEFKHAHEYARTNNTDSEALLKKEILWFRIECFYEHSTNQIGLATEPTRAASYAAARAGRYAAPRHAKIMNDNLAELIAQEKNLEAEKAKRGF